MNTAYSKAVYMAYLKGHTNARWSVIKCMNAESQEEMIKRCGAWDNFIKWYELVYKPYEEREEKRRAKETAKAMEEAHRIAERIAK